MPATESYTLKAPDNMEPDRDPVHITSSSHETSSSIRDINAGVTSNNIPDPKSGCVILGKSGHLGQRYSTRYIIDHKLQHRGMTGDILKQTFVPCFLKENYNTVGSFLWSFISSESFLLALHVLALGLGVSKEAMEIREDEEHGEKLELLHSSLETTAACVQIGIRVTVGFLTYRSIKEHVLKVEDVGKVSTAIGTSMRRTIIGYVVIGVLLISMAIGCMVAFKYLAHLGWTILSNQFAMVIALIMDGILSDRMNAVISTIREDQHKAVLYEATLLLQEAREAFDSKAPDFYFDQVNNFLEGLKNTELFKEPGHIRHSRHHSSTIDMKTIDNGDIVTYSNNCTETNLLNIKPPN